MEFEGVLSEGLSCADVAVILRISAKGRRVRNGSGFGYKGQVWPMRRREVRGLPMVDG